MLVSYGARCIKQQSIPILPLSFLLYRKNHLIMVPGAMLVLVFSRPPTDQVVTKGNTQCMLDVNQLVQLQQAAKLVSADILPFDCTDGMILSCVIRKRWRPC
jgi:hypothetical protein